jgi:Na+-driven multidrug efflux pump
MEARKAKLTEGSVGRHLVKMTVPMLLGITMMMAQSIIDAWFLGKVGDSALAAFSFGFPILMIITSVAIGLSAGTSSVVARAIGADDMEEIRTELFAPGNLTTRYQSINVDVQKRIRYLRG